MRQLSEIKIIKEERTNEKRTYPCDAKAYRVFKKEPFRFWINNLKRLVGEMTIHMNAFNVEKQATRTKSFATIMLEKFYCWDEWSPCHFRYIFEKGSH